MNSKEYHQHAIRAACEEIILMGKIRQHLPLPLAQLKRRAAHAKSAQERHLAAYYWWEAGLKLLASTAIVEYALGKTREPNLTELFQGLAKPSTGHWWEIVRRLIPVLADRGDSDFQEVRDLLLGRTRNDLPYLVGMNREIFNVISPDDKSASRASVNLTELFHKMVVYRNRVIGHGGLRSPEYFERMSEVFVRGLGELYQRLDPLAGRRLIYVSDVELDQSGGQSIHRFELSGLEPYRLPRWMVQERILDRLPKPRSVYLVHQSENDGEDWNLSTLTPMFALASFDADQNELLLLNGRSGRENKRAGYMGYVSGQEVTDSAAELTRLLNRILENDVDEADLDNWAIESEVNDPELAPVQNEVREPRRLAEFELLSRIGRGGMGVVYRAFQPSLGRQVAVKRLAHPGNSQSVSRFSREIRALGQVDHPHLVKIFCSGSDGEDWFYAMELVEGADLGSICQELNRSDVQLIDETLWHSALSTAYQKVRSQEEAISDDYDGADTMPIPAAANPKTPDALPEFSNLPGSSKTYVKRTVKLLRQVTEAAQALHDRGIIHRDIKPGNILINPPGTHAVLLDLGLAQLADEMDGRVTRTRQFVGTLRYASPEQVLAAGNLDSRTDVYSLGATLWETLTLRPLFDATDETPPPELMLKIQSQDPPSPRRFNSKVDGDLSAVVMKCLEKNRDLRYATAEELAQDLARWQNHEPVLAKKSGVATRIVKSIRRHRRQWRTALSYALIIAATVLAAFFMFRRPIRVPAPIPIAEDSPRDKVQHLLDARTLHVPKLIEQLKPYSKEIQNELQSAYKNAEQSENTAYQLHAALALVEVDPSYVDFLSNRLLHAKPDEFATIRASLEPHMERIKPALWHTLESRADAPKSFRAAMMLARDYPKDRIRWKPHHGFVAEHLIEEVSTRRESASVFFEELEPLQSELEMRLRYLLHEPDGVRQNAATRLLTILHQDNPEVLASLALSTVENSRGREHFADQLKQALSTDWLTTRKITADRPPVKLPYEYAITQEPVSDSALERTKLAFLDGKRILEGTSNASGWKLTRYFALSHAAPFDEWLTVADSLRGLGYRPTQCRPYATDRGVRVASIFRRDGIDWTFVWDKSPEEIHRADEHFRGKGYVPVDVSGYLEKDHTNTDYEQYCCIWMSEGDLGIETDRRLIVGKYQWDWEDETQRLRSDRGNSNQAYEPLRIHVMSAAMRRLQDGDDQRLSGIWERGQLGSNTQSSKNLTRSELEEFLKNNERKEIWDVCVTNSPNKIDPKQFWTELLNRSETTLATSPNNSDAAIDWAWAAWHLGRDDEVMQNAERLAKILKGQNREAELLLFQCLSHLRLENIPGALAVAEQYGSHPDGAFGIHQDLEARILVHQGQHEEAFRKIEEILANDTHEFRGEEYKLDNGDFYEFACFYATSARFLRLRSGNSVVAKKCEDRGVELLKKAVDQGWSQLRHLLVDSDIDGIRQHPLFDTLVKELNQPKYSLVYPVASESGIQSIPNETEFVMATSVEDHIRQIDSRMSHPPIAITILDRGGDTIVASCWEKKTDGESDDIIESFYARTMASALMLRQRMQGDQEAWGIVKDDPVLSAYLDRKSSDYHRWLQQQADSKTELTDEQLWMALEEVKVKTLDWNNTTGDARKWWLAFEEENKLKIALVLKVAQEISKREATITDFFLAYVYANTDNILSTLYYLDYTLAKDRKPTFDFEKHEQTDEKQLRDLLKKIKREKLDWNNTTGDARKWWMEFEEKNKNRPAYVLAIAEQMAEREATVADFCLAEKTADTENMLAILHYLKYLKSIPKVEADDKNEPAPSPSKSSPSEAPPNSTPAKELPNQSNKKTEVHSENGEPSATSEGSLLDEFEEGAPLEIEVIPRQIPLPFEAGNGVAVLKTLWDELPPNLRASSTNLPVMISRGGNQVEFSEALLRSTVLDELTFLEKKLTAANNITADKRTELLKKLKTARKEIESLNLECPPGGRD